MPSTEPLLLAEHLARRHPDGQGWLLHDVSLEVRSGERLAVVGPSGSGKTLLLRAMTLLDPVERGEVRWKGRGLLDHEVPGFRREAIYVHQRTSLGEQTVEVLLRQPFSLKVNRERQFDRRRVVELLAAMGRDASFLKKPSRELSGGEAQITALVRALQLEPKLLLLDEPTAALDTQATETVERLIVRWVDEVPGRALIWVSHDLAQSHRVTQRTAVMAGGRLARST